MSSMKCDTSKYVILHLGKDRLYCQQRLVACPRSSFVDKDPGRQTAEIGGRNVFLCLRR